MTLKTTLFRKTIFVNRLLGNGIFFDFFDNMSETIFISAIDNLWRAHADGKNICKPFILRTTAIAAAINHIKSYPEGVYTEIKVQKHNGDYYTYWTLTTDAYPPKKKPPVPKPKKQ